MGILRYVQKRLRQVRKAAVRVFDNGGKMGTARYTAFIGAEADPQGESPYGPSVYVVSEDPFGPNGEISYRGRIGEEGWNTGGVDNYVEAMRRYAEDLGGDIGREVAFEDVPMDVREAIQGAMVKRARGQRLQKDYEGWTNWETWQIALYSGNDEAAYNTIRRGRPYEASSAEMMARDVWPNGTPDMTTAAEMNEVNWDEIAELWNEE